jgi:DNA replication protein DnaC
MAPPRRQAQRTDLRRTGLLPPLATPGAQAAQHTLHVVAPRRRRAALARAHRGHNALPRRGRHAARTAHRTLAQGACDHPQARKAQQTRRLALGRRAVGASHRAVLCLGTPGTGNPFGATCLASAACHATLQGRCPTAMARSKPLMAAAAQAWWKKLPHDATPDLRGGDEWGARALGHQGAPRFFPVISPRPPRQSPVMTTNVPCADWGTVCDAPPVATALADRRVHHAEGLLRGGRSARSQGTAQQPRRTTAIQGGEPCPAWPPTPFVCRCSHDNKAPVRPQDTPATFSTDDVGLLCGRW